MRRLLVLAVSTLMVAVLFGLNITSVNSATAPVPEDRIQGEVLSIPATADTQLFRTQKSYNGPVKIVVSGTATRTIWEADPHYYWSETWDAAYRFRRVLTSPPAVENGPPTVVNDSSIAGPRCVLDFFAGNEPGGVDPALINVNWGLVPGISYHDDHSYTLIYDNQALGLQYGPLSFRLDGLFWNPIGRPEYNFSKAEFSGGFQITITPLKYAERDALISLYDSAGGPGWINRTEWLSSPNPCRWYGVQCEATGQLFSLGLGQNNLVGTLPSLSGLAKLRYLDLYSNSLSGPIPPSISELTSLEYLHLVRNQLSGPIPEMGTLSRLKRLDLDSNALSGPIPASLGSLTSLEYLRLSFNQLTGTIPESLGNLTNLKELHLGANSLGGQLPASLGKLTQLEQLSLIKTQVNGSLPDLSQLTKLKTLTLFGNQFSGDITGMVGGASNRDKFRNFASLEKLILNDNRLSGSIPPELRYLTSLTELDLRTNQLTGSVPQQLGELRLLQKLSLSFNQLSGPIPDGLGGMASLIELDLGDNNLTSCTLPSDLGNLRSIQKLRLGMNPNLSGSLPVSYLALGLSTLNIGGTDICVPSDDRFRSWLNAIPDRQTSGKECPATQCTSSTCPVAVTLRRPVDGVVTSSVEEMAQGVDILPYADGAAIAAAADGIVARVETERDPAGAYTVWIWHCSAQDLNGTVHPGISTRYLHLKDIPAQILNGAGRYRVRAGDSLGKVASSARHGANYERFRFEVRKGGSLEGVLSGQLTLNQTESLDTEKFVTYIHPMVKPAEGPLTSNQGTRRNGDGSLRKHEGIDIGAGEGTPVVAAADGRVIAVNRAGITSAAGYWVWVYHGAVRDLSGRVRPPMTTRYLHMKEIPDWHPGDWVRAGESMLGKVSNTGDGYKGAKIGIHLHFEVRNPRQNLEYEDLRRHPDYRTTFALSPLDFVTYSPSH